MFLNISGILVDKVSYLSFYFLYTVCLQHKHNLRIQINLKKYRGFEVSIQNLPKISSSKWHRFQLTFRQFYKNSLYYEQLFKTLKLVFLNFSINRFLMKKDAVCILLGNDFRKNLVMVLAMLTFSCYQVDDK